MALFDEIKREYDRGCKVYAIVTSNSYNGIADLVAIGDNSMMFASPIFFSKSSSQELPNGNAVFEATNASRFEVYVSKSESGLTMAEAGFSIYYPSPTPPIEVVQKNDTVTKFINLAVGSQTLDAAKNNYAKFRPYLVFNGEPFIAAEITENSVTVVYIGKGEDGQYGVQKTTFGGITWKSETT